MKLKKSQGLPINTVIVAIIALVVLIVVIAIFTNVTGKTSKNIGGCVEKGGLCADDNKLKGKCGGDYPVSIFVSGACEKTNPKNLCCLKIDNE